jgi:flagellar M-ring protein FliF
VEKTTRVSELLEPVVGRDNLRATVTADVDFTQVESTSEQFRPNQGSEPAASRSQATIESSTPGSAVPAGVPGAASNQPPVPATAPINGAAAPLQASNTQTGGAGRREATTNYEVDKTVQMKRNAVGVVKRLNAAGRQPQPDRCQGQDDDPPAEQRGAENLTGLAAVASTRAGARCGDQRAVQGRAVDKVNELLPCSSPGCGSGAPRGGALAWWAWA